MTPKIKTLTTTNEKCKFPQRKELSVALEKIKCIQHKQVWKVTESELSDLPLSKYRMDNYYPIVETVNWPSECDTPEKYYSTDTEIYWPLDEKELETHMMRKDLQATQDKLPEHSTKQCKSRKSGFQLRSHKLRRYRQKYYFKCQ